MIFFLNGYVAFYSSFTHALFVKERKKERKLLLKVFDLESLRFGVCAVTSWTIPILVNIINYVTG